MAGQHNWRAGRAVAALALAAAAVLVVGGMYLRPTLEALTISAPGSAEPAAHAPQSIGILGASFGDADHGMVLLSAPIQGVPGLQIAFITQDGGRTWSRLPGPANYVFEGPQRLVDYSTGAARISEDSGHAWRSITDPRHGLTSSLYPIPTFIDSRNGWWLDSYTEAAPQSVTLWRTRDGGRTWIPLGRSGIPDDGVKSQPAFSDLSHGLITVTASPTQPSQVLETEDGGESWRQVASVSAPALDALVIGQPSILTQGRRMVAAFQAAQGVLVEPNGYHFPTGAQVVIQALTLVSDDAGRTWGPPQVGPRVSGPAPYVLDSSAVAMDGSGRLVLLDGHKLWTSSDRGVSWTPRQAVMPEKVFPLGRPQAAQGVLFVPALNRPIPTYISATAGPLVAETLLRSRDGGIHWERVPLPAPSRVA